MIVFFLVLAMGFAAGKLGIIERDYLRIFAKLITTIPPPVTIFALTRNGSTRQMVFESWRIIVFSIAFYAAITLKRHLLGVRRETAKGTAPMPSPPMPSRLSYNRLLLNAWKSR